MSERDPLLPRQDSTTGHTAEGHDSDGKGSRPLGPLEISRSTRCGILAGIWSATFLSVLNQTLVPTMLPSISSEFNQANQAGWLGTSYLLSTCTFTPLYGRLCDVLGRKGANRTALLFTAVGVIMCGLSSSMEMLILARFLAGIGGGGLMTTSSIIVSDMYSLRSRGLTQGISSVFIGLGLGLGGPIGGLITDKIGWRWAFLFQMPFFLFSFTMTSINLTYTTEGTGRSAKDILKRIDYFGSGSLLLAVGSILVFLAARYNESLPWSHPAVITSLLLGIILAIAFVLIELYVAPEPVLARFLLKQKVPVLLGMSNFLVSMCNFSIVYYFPMFFQTVMLTNASTGGLHLLPNSVSMSLGSIFSGVMIHRTGRYKMLSLVFGAFTFMGAVFIYNLREDSGPIQSWLSIIPVGFGNSIVYQTMLIALLAHLPKSCVAVGIGFNELFRGLGQVGGVAISSAIFQSRLEGELRSRIHGPNADEIIKRIRQSSRIIGSLPPDLKRKAQDSYAGSLKAVFFFAACSTLLAYIVRLPIPDKELTDIPQPNRGSESTSGTPSTQASASRASTLGIDDDETIADDDLQKDSPAKQSALKV